MTLYFGYGSNLDAEDWDVFCTRWGFRGAMLEPVSPALMLDAELVFDRYSASRRGGALNLRTRPGQAAEGVVFRANATALRALDRKEGAPIAYRRAQRHAVLGSVEIWDSPSGRDVIQALDGSIRFERRPVGKDGTALSGEGGRPRTQRSGQPVVRRGGAMDRPYR